MTQQSNTGVGKNGYHFQPIKDSGRTVTFLRE